MSGSFQVTVSPAHTVQRGRRMNPTVEAVLTLQLDGNGAPSYYDDQVMAYAILYTSNDQPAGGSQTLSNSVVSPYTDFGGNGQGGSSRYVNMRFHWPDMTVNVRGNRLKLLIQVYNMHGTSSFLVATAWSDDFNCV